MWIGVNEESGMQLLAIQRLINRRSPQERNKHTNIVTTAWGLIMDLSNSRNESFLEIAGDTKLAKTRYEYSNLKSWFVFKTYKGGLIKLTTMTIKREWNGAESWDMPHSYR